MALDMSSMEKAIDALRRSITAAQSKTALLDEDIREAVRAGVAQNFEVAYELSWKFIQRWIRENRTPEDADHPRTRKDLFRLAARYGLIADPKAWFAYSDARNLTSHTYNEKDAAAVYEAARLFLDDAANLLREAESGK